MLLVRGLRLLPSLLVLEFGFGGFVVELGFVFGMWCFLGVKMFMCFCGF